MHWAGVDSVSNLVRRAEKRYAMSRKWKQTVVQLEAILGLNTEHKACPPTPYSASEPLTLEPGATFTL